MECRSEEKGAGSNNVIGLMPSLQEGLGRYLKVHCGVYEMIFCAGSEAAKCAASLLSMSFDPLSLSICVTPLQRVECQF